MGSLTRTSAANLFEVVYSLPKERAGRALFAGALYRKHTSRSPDLHVTAHFQLALAEQANFYLATLGPCDEHSLLFKHRYLSGLELQDLKRAGAVCDCMGKFFDANGQVAPSDVNQRTLAVDLEQLYEREVILLCAGREKLQAVKGLLKAGFVKGLIIDGDTALWLNEARD